MNVASRTVAKLTLLVLPATGLAQDDSASPGGWSVGIGVAVIERLPLTAVADAWAGPGDVRYILSPVGRAL